MRSLKLKSSLVILEIECSDCCQLTIDPIFWMGTSAVCKKCLNKEQKYEHFPECYLPWLQLSYQYNKTIDIIGREGYHK